MLHLKIKQLREKSGMTKAQLSRAVGVTDVTVGYWESSAIKEIGSDKLLKLAGAFGISVSELLDDPLADKPGLEWALSVSEGGVSSEAISESVKTRLQAITPSLQNQNGSRL